MAVVGDINSMVPTANPTGVSSKISQELGKYDFLKILAAELTHQDPSDPTSNKDFIAQMAQFSSLEQMQNMSESFNSLDKSFENYLATQGKISGSLLVMQSAGLIGKNAVAQVDGSSVEGRVDSILIKDSIPYAVIGGNTVPVNSITNISQENEVPVVTQENAPPGVI